MPNIVVDNGGGSIKWGFAGEQEPRRVMPASIVRGAQNKKYVGDELENCKSFANLHFQQPCDRGYTCDWGTLQTLWERGLSKAVLNVKAPDCTLLVSEPPNCPSSIQKSMDSFIFEDLGFAGYYRTQAARMAAANTKSQVVPAMTVIDCGFSFAHVSPVFDGFVANYAVRRVNIGGKLLTNQLKELVSYRAMNMMNETYTINDAKEKICFVSQNFNQDLETARRNKSELHREYVLPDYQSIPVGFVRDPNAPKDKEPEAPPASKRRKKEVEEEDDTQALMMSNERFAVPELLFAPTDIGLPQGGIAEAVKQSIECCAQEIQPLLWANILLVGGSTKIQGFKDRLELDLRALAPTEFEINILAAPDPITHSWQGGAIMASLPEFDQYCVTKKEYDEFGADAQIGCQRRFML